MFYFTIESEKSKPVFEILSSMLLVFFFKDLFLPKSFFSAIEKIHYKNIIQ